MSVDYLPVHIQRQTVVVVHHRDAQTDAVGGMLLLPNPSAEYITNAGQFIDYFITLATDSWSTACAPTRSSTATSSPTGWCSSRTSGRAAARIPSRRRAVHARDPAHARVGVRVAVHAVEHALPDAALGLIVIRMYFTSEKTRLLTS